MTAKMILAVCGSYCRVVRLPMLLAISVMVGLPLLFSGFIALTVRRTVAGAMNELPTMMFYPSFLVIGLAGYTIAIVGPQWVPTFRLPFRLYASPISNRLVVACYMACAIVLMIAATWITMIAFLVLLDVDWLYWGPLLFSGVFVAYSQASFWQLRDFEIRKLAVWLATTIALMIWLAGRYFPMGWQHKAVMWDPVTPVDLLVMCGIVLGSYGLAVDGYGRSRRGDRRTWPDWNTLVDQLLGRLTRPKRKLSSATGAQFWYEWRQYGVVGPILALAVQAIVWGLLMASGTWGADFLEMMIGVAGFAPVMAGIFGSLLHGHQRCAAKQQPGVGTFLASRPLSDMQLAGCILKASTAGLLATTAICWLSVGLAYAVNWFMGQAVAGSQVYSKVNWLQAFGSAKLLVILLASLAVGWALSGLMLASGLAKNRKATGVEMFAVEAYFILWGALAIVVGDEYRSLVHVSNSWLTGCVSLVVTIVSYSIAWRRQLLSTAAMCFAFFGWLILCGVVMAGAAHAAFEPPIHIVVLFGGLISLAVLPFAAVPVAISSSRHT